VPIFEYECRKCEHTFERLVMGSNSRKSVTCPECRSRRVEQLYSGFYGRSQSSSGVTRSLSSGCSSCSAKSCAGCK